MTLKNCFTTSFKTITLLFIGLVGFFFITNWQPVAAKSLIIPDISEWRGKLSASQVKKMKSQVAFVINRRQYGASYIDKYATNNTNLYAQYGVPFGEYDYATFKSVAGAKKEANCFTPVPIRILIFTFWTTKKMTLNPDQPTQP